MVEMHVEPILHPVIITIGAKPTAFIEIMPMLVLQLILVTVDHMVVVLEDI